MYKNVTMGLMDERFDYHKWKGYKQTLGNNNGVSKNKYFRSTGNIGHNTQNEEKQIKIKIKIKDELQGHHQKPYVCQCNGSPVNILPRPFKSLISFENFLFMQSKFYVKYRVQYT